MHGVTKHIVLVQWTLKCCKLWASIDQMDSNSIIDQEQWIEQAFFSSKMRQAVLLLTKPLKVAPPHLLLSACGCFCSPPTSEAWSDLATEVSGVIPACPAATSSNCSASLSKKDLGVPGSWCWYVMENGPRVGTWSMGWSWNIKPSMWCRQSLGF